MRTNPKNIEVEFDTFTEIMKRGGNVRTVRHEIGKLPVLIVIEDIRPENITLGAYIPHFGTGEIGHVFATGTDGKFKINDLYVDPKYRENLLGSKLLKETLTAIGKYKPTLIKGNFKIEESGFPKVKYLFEKFGFSVSQEPDSHVSMFKEYPGN